MLLPAGRPATSDSEPKPQGRGTETGARVAGHGKPETSVEGGTCEPAMCRERLSGLLPICSYCKKIREEQDHWVQLEQYIDDRTDASFSHGICPDCYQNRVLPEIEQWQKAR